VPSDGLIMVAMNTPYYGQLPAVETTHPERIGHENREGRGHENQERRRNVGWRLPLRIVA